MQLTPLRLSGDRFIDGHGREVILRGVNLGGDCKLPYHKGETWRNDDFAGHREVSFVARPFPLDEAAEHLSRLRSWGFNCLRLLTTWEAVEHAGPGQYDVEYLDYYEEICRLAGQHGFYVFVDFHQDVWSRMTGGSGAPGWTLEEIGIDIAAIEPSGAAITMQRSFDAEDANPHQPSYPQMIWSSNYGRAANGIMWSLFFAGKTLVPDFLVGDEHAQDLLRRSYKGAVKQVAMRVAKMPHVIGFDTLNEPSIGWLDSRLSQNLNRGRRITPSISPLAGLAAATGLCVDVPVLGPNSETPQGIEKLNPDAIRLWKAGASCPFEAAGIYRIENGLPVAIDEEVFQRGPDGVRLDVPEHVYGPFFAEIADTIREIRPDWLLFAELEPFAFIRGHHFPEKMPPNSVNASHWYDVSMLYHKALNLDNYVDLLTGETVHGVQDVTRHYIRQLSARKAEAERFGGAPTLIGEFGIPYDLDHGTGYEAWREGRRDEAFQPHAQALGMMYDALDALKLNSTQWNYTASNRNDLRIGDGWNQEDLSIFSRDQEDGPDAGGRATQGFARPYVRAAQGRLVAASFDRRNGRFVAEIDIDPAIAAHTDIALPLATMGTDPEVHVIGCEARIEMGDGHVTIHCSQPGVLAVQAKRRGDRDID